ncbi:hypothetical protein AAG570_008984 [Ranatra chinensis]|uniref:Sm domain-containing protein n=1 Tax=Ranatra chinensis TaxID=642074 RepID=A0ABD0Z5B9_9HEMI
MAVYSAREKFLTFNLLTSLAQGVIGQYTTVDLRNESFATGKIEEVDGCMNVTMTDVVFSDPSGNECYYDFFFIKERNIRYIHIPNTVSRTLIIICRRERERGSTFL